MLRDDAIRLITTLAARYDAAIFVGNGYNARALHAALDRPEFFYMVGSMGLCATIAAGFSNAAGRPTISVEGDGNALMGLSGFPVAAAAARGPYVRVVLDNAMHESSGCHQTLSAQVDFSLLAAGAGYDPVFRPQAADELEAALEQGLRTPQSSFIYVATDAQGGAHPRVPFHPREIAARFRAAVGATS
jgi:phosphonopyruvate decarboxylase